MTDTERDEPRGIAIFLLLISVAAYGVASALLAALGPEAPPEMIRTTWALMLTKISAAACVGAYGLGALWLRARGGAAWRLALSLVVATWTVVNLAVWTPAAFRLGEPVACAAPAAIAPLVVMPDPCRHCDTGEAPLWWCLLIGCW